ncbi:MAG: hypothetical protein HRT61_12510 [Ekhidna sp.]|nr:hypothetical protein [Ekhidna sp.]
MKNVTLAIPDQTLQKARAYAQKHNTTLNNMIREFLKSTVETEQVNLEESLKDAQSKLNANSKRLTKREDLYER